MEAAAHDEPAAAVTQGECLDDDAEAIIARYAELGRRETLDEAYAGRAGGPPSGMALSVWMLGQVARVEAAAEAARAVRVRPCGYFVTAECVLADPVECSAHIHRHSSLRSMLASTA